MQNLSWAANRFTKTTIPTYGIFMLILATLGRPQAKADDITYTYTGRNFLT